MRRLLKGTKERDRSDLFQSGRVIVPCEFQVYAPRACQQPIKYRRASLRSLASALSPTHSAYK